MAKIPFNIKYRPQIESGEYKVVTVKEQPVRIICWDRSTTYWKIIALVLAPDGKTENPFTYDVNGNESDGCLHNHEFDLFLITPEPELTEFEKAVSDVVEMAWLGGKDNPYEFTKEEYAKIKSLELLSLARKELQPEIDVEVEKAYKNADRMQYEKGKEDALKDLPMWKKANGEERFNERLIVLAGNNDLLCTNYAEEGEYYISFSDLEKLPKEETK